MNKIESAIKAILVDEQDIKETSISPGALLREEIGLREFDVINLCMALEEKYKIQISDEDAKAATVSDLARVVKRLILEKTERRIK